MQKDMMLKKIEQANVMTQTGDSKINPINFSLFKLKTGWKEIRQNMLGLFILALFISGVFLQSAFAQAPPSSSKPSGYEVSYSGDINYYNGNVSFNLPLLTVGGRGEASYTMIASIGQQKWQVMVEKELVTCNPSGCIYRNVYIPALYGESPVTNGLSPGRMVVNHTGKYYTSSCPGGQAALYQRLTTIIFSMPGGASVTLRDQLNDGRPMDGAACSPTNGPNRGTVFESWDGSGMTFISDSPIEDKWNVTAEGATGNLYLKNGVKYRIENGNVMKITDRNGNFINFTYNETSYPYSGFTATDSIGRNVTVLRAADGTVTITTARQNNATRTIRIYGNGGLRSDHSPLTWTQAFPELNGASRYTGNISETGIGFVELPDGRSYRFKYSPYSELARVELPTGGAIEYDYASGSGTGSGAFATSPSGDSLTAYGYVYRRAVEMRVYDNGGSGANYTNKTTIQKSVASGNLNAIVRAYEAGNSTPTSRADHFYYGDPTFGFHLQDPFYPETYLTGMEYQTDFYAGDGNQLLRRSENTWQPRIVPAWAASYNPNAGKDARLIESKTTLADTNQVSKVVYGYDNFNNQTDVYEYNFGNGSPGAFLRRSHTDYVTDANYLNVSLKSLPSQTWVSSDPNGTNIVSRNLIEYDNYSSDARHAPLLGRGNAVGHDTANYSTGYPWRGNPTQTVSFGNAASQTEAVISSIQYDILGNPVKTIDANGNVSVVNFNDNFGVPNGEARTNSAPGQLNGQQTFAFATIVTNSKGWVGYAQFDYFTGLKVDAEDINGNVNSSFYNDLLDRLTQTIFANNTGSKRQITYIYDDVNRRIQTTSDLFSFGDNLAKAEKFCDSLGRTTQNRKYEENGGYIAILTEYDALGRVKRVTNPYRPAQNEPQLWTTTNYDALSRPISVTTPDGATATTNYSGNVTTGTDQVGKQRRSITNGLGQLVRMDEPDDNGNLGSISSPTQPTSYEYNTIGKMVKVTQGVQARFFLYDSLGRLLRVRQPEQVPNANLNFADAVTGNSQWTAGFNYDANGNLLTARNANNVEITSTYDNLNRPLTRTYSDGTPTVTYSYDNPNIPFSKGNLTQVQNAVSTSQALAFDNLGRTLASRQITDGVNYDSSYLYNLSGALVEETYPSGRKVKNTFEADGDLSKVETQVSGGAYQIRLQNPSYTASGIASQLQLGNGLWETAQLNSRLQVTQLGLGTSPTDTSVWKLNYDFVGTTNNDGNIKSQTLTTPNAVYTQTFQYDSLNRLKQAEEKVSGNQTWVQNFSYDRYGNRVGFNQTVNGQTTNGTPSVDVNTNRFNTGQGYVYDFAGNVVQDPQNRQFVFNGDNKQVQVKDANQNVIGTYLYDGNGKRIKKVTNQESTTFVYSGGKLVAEYTLTTATPTAPTTNYMGTDILGSPRIVTNQNAQVVSRRDFMPFGEDIPNVGNRTQAIGYKTDNLRQKFTGYQKDNETGLDFAQARYYNNSVGRFTAVDPLLASGRSANPQTFNRYSYTANNPVIFTDPSGLDYYQDKDGNIVYIPGSRKHKDLTNITGTTGVVKTVGPLFSAAGANVGDTVYYGRNSITVVSRYKDISTDFVRVPRPDTRPDVPNPGGDTRTGRPKPGDDPSSGPSDGSAGNPGDWKETGAHLIWWIIQYYIWEYENGEPCEDEEEWVKVGWWSPREDYEKMVATGRVVPDVGQDGTTFVTVAQPNGRGPDGWDGAKKGWVYSEFEIRKMDVLKAGAPDWFQALHPESTRTRWKERILEQGGELRPFVRNITGVLLVKQ
jgi:RHS repeat-associated protein